MGLLTMNGEQLVIQPEFLAFPIFEKVWNNKDRVKAVKQLTYVYLYADVASPFRQYPSENGIRQNKIVEALELSTDDITVEVLNAVTAYKEYHMTYSYKLLEDAEAALHKLRTYFNDVNLLEVNDRGMPIYKASDLVATISKLGSVVKGIKDLKDEVEKEQADKVRARGGAKVDRKYEVPK